MGLQENLLRGIYAYGFEKPSAIQQRGIEKPNEEKEEIEKPNEEKEETMNIRVKQISEKPDRIAPIVAYFASGYDPSDKFDGDGDGDGHCSDVEVYRHKAGTKSKRLQVVVSPPGSSVKFVGSNYTGEGATGQTCVYTLGVLDKEKQTLKILPIASNKIFRLEPRVKNAESVDSEASLGGVSTELTAAERAVKARKLNNLYGTKSAINRDKKMRALNPGDDPESQQHLEGKLNEMEIKKEALESTDSIISRNIPPCDVSAATPREAYPLDQIILKGEWGFLEDIYFCWAFAG
ncbi:PREDICTED: uncharacterized protein LOC104822769 [Tarenaya hassleriana]|uniref:uncharacterized protein LOC104822769 n=1 Tax=Tarenaya hassleriana TaxID=28532 RepID=UPI00053C2A02|nr:PREDICTED: uncharacterized protein LOC104822769 [Tarenaya hassleriana]